MGSSSAHLMKLFNTIAVIALQVIFLVYPCRQARDPHAAREGARQISVEVT
jgi:hypothetical protein